MRNRGLGTARRAPQHDQERTPDRRSIGWKTSRIWTGWTASLENLVLRSMQRCYASRSTSSRRLQALRLESLTGDGESVGQFVGCLYSTTGGHIRFIVVVLGALSLRKSASSKFCNPSASRMVLHCFDILHASPNQSTSCTMYLPHSSAYQDCHGGFRPHPLGNNS